MSDPNEAPETPLPDESSLEVLAPSGADWIASLDSDEIEEIQNAMEDEAETTRRDERTVGESWER